MMAIFGGGLSALNETLIKEHCKMPRPSIVQLAGKDGSGPLGQTAKAFYESGNKTARSETLSQILTDDPPSHSLSKAIADHWVHETGYSFPSGHSFSALFFATFLLAVAVMYTTKKRLWVFYLLLPWALGVCYSRSILRVHTPTDIAVGSLLGTLAGFVAFIIARQMMRWLSKS
jgi:phosphatidylglycerophosphatase B